MIEAARFLSSLGRALSTSSLYRDGHPTLDRAVGAAWGDLTALLAVAPRATFTFLGETVLFGDLPLPDRRGWEWSERLAEAGIQRVQFEAPVAQEDFERFLAELSTRLAGQAAERAEAQPRASRIRFGAVGLRSEVAPLAETPLRTATLAFVLDSEIETAQWVEDEVIERRPIPLVEVEAIVRSLSVAMHANPQMVLPLIQLKECDQYTTTHSLNVSVLAMGLGERMGLAAGDVRSLGVAGLLHDIGKTLIPREILTKAGRLTGAEREAIMRHPADGARLILQANEDLDLAAVVAYEHHIGIDGTGYPRLRYSRPCHEASRLVHVCDVFDALRTQRPYRPAWPVDAAFMHLRERAGQEFDPPLVDALVAMIEQCGQAAG